MPELPEVETVRTGLEKSLKGKVIKKTTLRRKNLRIPFPKNLSKNLEGRRIINIRRRAKYLIIELDNENALIMHLGMSGKILVKNSKPENLNKHDHVIIEFNGGKTLIYNDARRFGLVTLCKKTELEKHKLLSALGPEPLSNEFNEVVLFNSLKKKTAPIKNVIMDSHVVVGVGNIYACESLFRSGISPIKKACDVPKKKVSELVKNIRDVLNEAIASGGSTLRDYVRSTGDSGYFQHKFQVYGREGKACFACHKPIKRIKQQGRSTFYCPNCQR